MSTLRLSTAGESHGPAEVCILSGVPAGLELTVADIDADLIRRQGGYGRGGRMAIETDRASFISGVRLGRTMGTPICILVENRDHKNWVRLMSPAAQEGGSPETVTIPRPGHADLSGLAKYGSQDVRDVLERASARETVARVAAGAVCKRILGCVGVHMAARVIRIGDVRAAYVDPARPDLVDWEAVAASPVACDDTDAAARMIAAIDEARARGESLGGVFEVWCWGTVPGVGGFATLEDRLDGRLMGAVGSIPAIKAVEIGDGFAGSGERGSRVHDALYLGKTREPGDQSCVERRTNRAGGIEGGMTTGMPIVVRAAMKPIPTLTAALPSVDLATMTETSAHVERSDVCAVPAARVVGEAMVAFVLASAYLEKFGGDSIAQLRSAVSVYEKSVEERWLWRRS